MAQTPADTAPTGDHSDTRQVGEPLRLRRQMRGMSLKQVAEPAGISVGMLRFMMKPGATSGEPCSNAEGGKCGLVVAGTPGLELNRVGMQINTGGSFACPASGLVRFWTIGEETCEVIRAVASPRPRSDPAPPQAAPSHWLPGMAATRRWV